LKLMAYLLSSGPSFRPGSDLECGQFGGSGEEQTPRFAHGEPQSAAEVLEVGIDIAALGR